MPAVPWIVMGAMAVGTMMTAQNQKAAGEAENQAYQANAQMQEQEAKAVETSTNYKAQVQAAEARRMSARQRVLYAKAGVDLGSGSPLLVMAEDAGNAARDVFMTRYAGEVEATKLRNQASLSRFYGDTAEYAGGKEAQATIIQGIGKVGSAYMGTKKPGYGG